MTISQSVILPRIANATMAATICAGLPSCWPSISRKPSPVEAPRNSAATTNIQPSPSPARSEITYAGMTAGSRMRRTIATPDRRKTRPTSTILRSTERTAPITPR